jgi:uncharacterized membrane protein
MRANWASRRGSRATIAGGAATALVFLTLDFTWLSTMGDAFYRPLLGDLLADHPGVAAAAAFYVIYLGGVVFFATLPGINAGSWRKALGKGAALGLVAYATYDLTNQATLPAWPLRVTLVDLGWGAFATATAAALGCLAGRAAGRAPSQ